jgi:hypothetical protein
VKNFKIAGMACSEEEYKLLLAKIREIEKKEDRRISVSQFLRDTILPILNGNNSNEPPIVPDTEQKIVSNNPGHTISEQKKEEENVWDSDFLEQWKE